MYVRSNIVRTIWLKTISQLCCEIVFTTRVEIYRYGGNSIYVSIYVQLIFYIWWYLSGSSSAYEIQELGRPKGARRALRGYTY